MPPLKSYLIPLVFTRLAASLLAQVPVTILTNPIGSTFNVSGSGCAPGTYTMFIDLKPNNWRLIISNWKAQARHDLKNTAEIWGAFGYTPDKDVVRAPMTASTLPWSVDQLTWEFTDMTDAGGKIMIMWDKTAASVPFKVGM